MNVQDVTSFLRNCTVPTYDSTLLYLTRRCADPTQIPDLLQEVYTEVYSVLPQRGAQYVKRPHTFVQHVAKSKLCRCYSLRKRLSCLIPLEHFGAEEAALDEGKTREIPMHELPEQLAEDKLLAAKIKALPADVQRILICHFWLDLSLTKTAKVLGMKETAVKSKV